MFKRFLPILSIMISAAVLTAAEAAPGLFINVRDHGAGPLSCPTKSSLYRRKMVK